MTRIVLFRKELFLNVITSYIFRSSSTVRSVWGFSSGVLLFQYSPHFWDAPCTSSSQEVQGLSPYLYPFTRFFSRMLSVDLTLTLSGMLVVLISCYLSVGRINTKIRPKRKKVLFHTFEYFLIKQTEDSPFWAEGEKNGLLPQFNIVGNSKTNFCDVLFIYVCDMYILQPSWRMKEYIVLNQ